MSNVKKYVLTSLTLGLIAAGGALLIAGTNMLTKDVIKTNEENKINSGIKDIFDNSDAFIKESSDEDCDEYQYVTIRYVVSDNNDNLLGYACRTDGYNSYGKISLIIGFDTSFDYEGLSVIANEQSFATTLNKNYLNVIKEGDKTVDDISVSCGATYGATLVKKMVNEAKQAAQDLAGE